MRKFLIAILGAIFINDLAMATPGDLGCTAMVNGKELEILVGRDRFDQPPVFVYVTLDGALIAKFHKDEISTGMVIAYEGTGGELRNLYFHGLNERGVVYLRFPEQNDKDVVGYLTINVPSAQLAVAEVKSSCEF